jgi:2-keto-4-pentenoate hydratase/2-oxohepta-3-ene-1,7-dioic acid hydratase in catechol pathway
MTASMLDLRDWAQLCGATSDGGVRCAEGAASDRVRPCAGSTLATPPPAGREDVTPRRTTGSTSPRCASVHWRDFDKSKDAQGDNARLRAYLFLKAPSCLAGAFDDIVLPAGEHRIDWEAELAVVIGRQGRNIPAARALDHVAGFMTTNDVSCRDLTWREDRPTIRSDWLAGKSFDTFAPTGPFFVPREFVPNHAGLRVWLAVNGVTKQDGNTGDMIFGTAEQIEYASRMLTLEPGDLFATGTPSGVGQGRGEFLKAGDVVECEVEGLGRQRNRVVQGAAEYSS